MPKVKLYTLTTCVYCRAEKNWLNEHHVAFEEILLDNDRQGQEEMIRLSGQFGVPFTVVIKDDGTAEHIVGFDQPRLAAALGLASPTSI